MEKNLKILIVTITNGTNYGNRLQNYALTSILQSLGAKVVTCKGSDENEISIMLKQLVKDCIKRMLGKTNTCFARTKRIRKFNQFNMKYIKFSEWSESDRYNFVVCGSDQIWNTKFDFIKNNLPYYLADFVEPRRKIAFAASFGANDICTEYIDYFSYMLSEFKALGIRENSGVKLANCLGKRNDCKLVLDPTLVLAKEEWQKIENKPNYIKSEKFIVAYYLGGRTSIINDYIGRIAEKYSAKVINLDIEFLFDNEIENKDYFATSPDEFVWLIEHAECVLTDSFHATIFSIIFNKPFLVFQRVASEDGNDMSDRIDTLLSSFGLENCKDDIINPSKTPFSYNDVSQIIERKREESLEFLKKALEG